LPPRQPLVRIGECRGEKKGKRDGDGAIKKRESNTPNIINARRGR